MKQYCKNYALFFALLFSTHTIIIAKTVEDYAKDLEYISQIISNNSHLHIGCEIYSLQHQQSLYAHNNHQLFIPASNTKLFTAILAHDLLALDYRFPTEFKTDGIINNGILNGNLYFSGEGDPSLKSTDIEAMIKYLSTMGLTHITGNLYVDTSAFDHECFAPGSLIDNLGASWNNPISALMVDRKPLGIRTINNIAFMDASLLQNMFFDGVTFFEELFKKYNIAFSGTIEYRPLHLPINTYTIIHTHYSEPMSALLSEMLKKSDNLYADCIFKKLGTINYDYPGTWHKGTHALTDFMCNKLATHHHQFIAKDGSGRSRYNLFTPHSIITLLNYAYTQPNFDAFADSLAITGIDGSLKNRLLDLTACVKAKTGTLDGVSALSGYIFTRDDILTFSIIVNAYITDSVYTPACKNDVEDAICRILYNA